MKAVMMACACVLVAGTALAADKPATVYDRVGARLQADPALAAQVGQPTPEIKSVAWLVGTWDVTAKVQGGSPATSTDKGVSTTAYVLGGTWLQTQDTYPGGTQDIGYLTYNPVTKQWVALGIDSTGNAVTTTSTGWQGNRLVLTGNVIIVGEPTMLRQTVEKVSDNGYDVINEEQMPDGSWIVLDRYEYRRSAS